MKSFLVKPYAHYIARRVNASRQSALKDQKSIFRNLIARGQQTLFGKDHHFKEINSAEDFRRLVPVRDYEGLKSYFDKMVGGERDVLWPDRPLYYAKTSGTTSGIKYIPITRESMPNHIGTARQALMNYAALGSNSRLFNGKVMFLSGSPTLTDTNGVATGRLSGIVNHEIPSWIKGNQLPSYSTNCIDDWEEKVDKIVLETVKEDLRLISGIPPWVQMYFERLIEHTGKDTIKEIFPNLQVFMYGGVNYEPYRSTIEGLIGHRIDSIELYPASEGFLAFQDTLENRGLLLNTNSGIFFEFIQLEDFFDDNPQRLTLDEVQIGKDYVLILSNNAGLWAYNLGDTIRFVSLEPYRVIVSGRVKHFISAFGEHVIGKEVDQAMQLACHKHQCSVREFTVAPQVNPEGDTQPYHEWFVEFDRQPDDLTAFSLDIDHHLRNQNSYYDDLISGNILRSAVIRVLPPDTFRNYMKSKGKLGGQNKVPRLSNDRNLVESLEIT